MSLFKKITSYIRFFFTGAKDMNWRAMPKNLRLEAGGQFHRASETIKKEYSQQVKKSSHLPPHSYLLWEAWLLFWRNKGRLFGIIFFPWLIATASTSVFNILLPKSLLFNYGSSLLITFLLLAMSVYPISFWAVGESIKNKTLSLRFSSWNGQKKDFIVKILFWLFIALLVFSSTFLAINIFFDFVGGLFPQQTWQAFTTFMILLSYFLLTFSFVYFFANWLMFIPYAIFQSKFHLLSIKQLYDLENLEDELKIFFGIIRQYHIWIFNLFLAILIIPIWVSMNGVVLATFVYYANNLATSSWLPASIRSNILQVILLNGVVLLVAFVSVTIITILLSRAFWLLRYKKTASFPIGNKNKKGI